MSVCQMEKMGIRKGTRGVWGMRLSKTKQWSLGIIAIVGICLIFMFLEHTQINVHSMTIDQPSTSIAEITHDLQQFLEQEGFTELEWNILWRGNLTTQQYHSFLTWLDAPEQGFERAVSGFPSSSNHQEMVEEIWMKEDQGTLHHIKVYTYPHKEQTITNFIYIWSGNQSFSQWSPTTTDIEGILTERAVDFQTFTTIEGVSDSFFYHQDQYQQAFNHWMGTYRGNVSNPIAEANFLSITGYIPTWGDQFLFAEQEKSNVQFAARFNAIAEQTRVTLGYPLILKEH